MTMAISDIIASWRLPAFGTKSAAAEESRLLKLYWNRAELKKQLADLDAERHQLRDRLKQQEATTERLEDEFHALEGLLGNPELGFEALIHYQLRALWRACHGQLEQFGSELVRQREDRERKRQASDYQQGRQQRLKAIVANQSLAEADVARSQAALAKLEADRRRLRGFWYYFRRRKLQRQAEVARAQLAELGAALDDVHAARRAVEQEPWPEFRGLSLEGKRSINLAVIAYAQLLFSRLGADELAGRTWHAQRNHVRDCRYGTRAECEKLMRDVSSAIVRVREARDIVGELRVRAEKLKAAVAYPHEDDAVPVPDSLPPNVLGAERALGEPNVLRDNYWDIFKLLRG